MLVWERLVEHIKDSYAKQSKKSHCLRARSIKRLGVFILPPGWDASPSQGYPQHYAGTQLYTWVERGTVRVKCLAQEHNAMSPARPRTRTTRSGVERTNHEATAPPRVQSREPQKNIVARGI